MRFLLQAENLAKTLNGTAVLDDVSLAVAPGEAVSIFGAGGTGKSTLLRLLAGIVPPDSGRVLLGGEDIANLPPRRRGTVFLPARDTLWPHLSARENVAFPLINAGSDADGAGEAAQVMLSSLSLEFCADRKPEVLSGGERQRVALARALVTRPRLLLLDGLFPECDAPTRQRLWKTVRRYCAETGAACVCAALPGGMELALADRVAVLALGKIQQEGTPLEIYRRPRTRAAGELLSRANVFAGRVRFAGAGEFVAETPLGEVRGALSDASVLPSPGAELDILIRPESLHIDLIPPDENAFAGNVTGGDFLGVTGTLVFQTTGGAHLRVAELNPRIGGGGLAGANALYAWVAPEDVTGILR